MAKNASLAMRGNMKRQMSGLASASVREKMLNKVLSQEYPTSRHCKREPRLRKVSAPYTLTADFLRWKAIT